MPERLSASKRRLLWPQVPQLSAPRSSAWGLANGVSNEASMPTSRPHTATWEMASTSLS